MEPTKFLVPNLEGVTVALVSFLLLCLAFPNLVKSKTHWYVSLFLTIGIILAQSVMTLFAGSELVRVFGVLVGVLQVLSIIMLVLAVGGLTPKELGAEALKTIEVIRRGDATKEVIVPLVSRERMETPRGRAETPHGLVEAPYGRAETPHGRVETPTGPIDEPEDRVVFSLDTSEIGDEQRIPLKPTPPPDKGPLPLV